MANFSEIQKKDCLLKKLPVGVKLDENRTVILQSVINEIKIHGRSSMNKEVCGVLAGNLCWDQEAYLLIDSRIEGKFADHQSGSVTFTSETWDYIHDELAKNYPDKKIVGWYHTHPGFGIFLSNMDFFIHENFFSILWQPAYVFDPQAETDGFFFWNKGNLDKGSVSIVPDEPPIDKEPVLKNSEKISVVITEGEEKAAQKKVFSIIANVFIILVIGCLVSLLWIFNGKINDLQTENKQLKTENTVLSSKYPHDKCENQLDEYKKQITLWKSRYAELEKKNKGNVAIIKNSQDHAAVMEEKGKEAQKVIVQKELEIDALSRRITDLSAEVKCLKKEVEPLQQLKTENAALREKSAEDQKKLAAWQKRLEDYPKLVEKIHELESQLKKYADEQTDEFVWYNPMTWF